MKFKYQLHEGETSFFAWVALWFLALWLVIVRLLRFCKRVWVYRKRYVPAFFCVCIFEIAVIPVGLQLGKYTSWTDGIWDLRNFFLTSILISFVGGVLQEERKRHQILTEQFQAYKTFVFESNQFLERLCLVTGIQYNREKFLNENQYKDFLYCMDSKIEGVSAQGSHIIERLPEVQEPHFMYSTSQIKPKAYIRMAFVRYLRVVDHLLKSLEKSEFIGTIDHAKDQLDGIYEETKNELIQIETDGDNYTELQLLKFIHSIFRYIYPTVGDIRRPWQWDIKTNDIMANLLKK